MGGASKKKFISICTNARIEFDCIRNSTVENRERFYCIFKIYSEPPSRHNFYCLFSFSRFLLHLLSCTCVVVFFIFIVRIFFRVISSERKKLKITSLMKANIFSDFMTIYVIVFQTKVLNNNTCSVSQIL